MKISNLLRIPQNKYPVKAILCWLWHAWHGNRLQAVLNAALGLLGVAASLMSVWAVQNAIDVASHVRSGSLYAAVALMGVFVLCDFGVSIASVWVRNILGIKAQNRMQQHMLDRILRSEWRGRERMHSGDVLNRLELDVRTVVEFLTETMPNTLSVVALFSARFLSVLHGRHAGRCHRDNAAAVYACQQALRGAHAQSYAQRSQLRQPRAERAAGNHTEPHAHKDS